MTVIFACAQELQNSIADGNLKIRNVSDKANIVSPNTDPRGQDLIRTEVNSLLDSYDKWRSNVNDSSAQAGMQNSLSGMIEECGVDCLERSVCDV